MGSGASVPADIDYAALSAKEIAEKAAALPLGHDLTQPEEHKKYMEVADQLYKLEMDKLRELEKITSEVQVDSFKYPVCFHIALKDAISKKLFEAIKDPIHCTVVFALYKEMNRILPKGAEKKAGECDPNGEDFIRAKHRQMSWLFSNKEGSTWTFLGMDDGCDGLDKKAGTQLKPSADLMEDIVKGEGYTNVTTFRLKECINNGTCKEAGLDVDKLKSEDWKDDDKLVKASQKAGAILTGLYLAKKEGETDANKDKKHIIVYTDSDLSTDLALCGLNFDTIINGKVDCSVCQRFGEPLAVNCGKLLSDDQGGGIAAGMPLESRVHLSLRHKLRMNLLPPLVKIIDTNCGHKALTPATAVGTVSMVRDYKGSFDIDWLMCVGIVAKKAGREAIGTTPIPWVNSVGESNFWGGGGKEEDPEAAKLKSCTSWHKIFATMTQMHDWHKDELEKLGLLTDECKAYVEWVKAMDVQQYMKLSDSILAKLGDKEVNMPADEIMNMSLDEMKKCCE